MSGFVTDHMAECCVCLAAVDTREEADGGDPEGCQLTNGLWVCNTECWDDAVNAEQEGAHPMTPPTTDTSRKAVEKMAEALEDISARTNMGFHKSHEADCLRALLAERDALRDQLAAARNEALEEAGVIADNWRKDAKKGEFFEHIVDRIGAEIRALKSAAPAPREVTVQEAARVLLQAEDRDIENAVNGGITRVRPYGYSTVEKTKFEAGFIHALRALANEEQSDG